MLNRGRSNGYEALLEAARVDDPDAKVGFGDHDAPVETRGTGVLGLRWARKNMSVHSCRPRESLTSRLVQDLRSAWLLFLFGAASRHLCSPRLPI